ncbi:hypothetical protein [Umezawaea tangerina]|uniref:Uncharacterized protein n=1 Tax=Umezawaea tangerina TaxID=84725 RepID=A0A2T0SK04_9PSEU|nr:hypothetical protein [Umezawaea tangerina]PRY33739.1 hypothetical protein CLV43_11946 [Umezawaea tangerina]
MHNWLVDGEDALLLDEGVVAVEVPAGWAGEVSHQLRSAGPLGPILAVAGARIRWLFLAEYEPEPAQRYVLPPDVRCWDGPRRLETGALRWVVAPGRSALPTVGAVRCAIRTVRRSLL